MDEKRCSKCMKVYPATTDYFYIRDDGKLRGVCRNCMIKNNAKKRKHKIIEALAKVYLVYEQECITDEPTLMRIFIRKRSAEKYIHGKQENCYMREFEVFK